MEKMRIDKWMGYWRVGPYPYNVLKNTYAEALEYMEAELARMEEQPLTSDNITTLKNVSYEEGRHGETS